MSAPTQESTTPVVRPSAPAGTPGNRTPRRHGAASRQVGAAGQTRRSLQRDLARREASLRISRRVSGPAGGVTRPPFADTPTPQPVAPAAPFNEPVILAPVAAPAAPSPAAPSKQAAPLVDLGATPAHLEIPSFVSAPASRGTRRVARPSAPAKAPQRPVAQPVQAQRPVARAAAAPQLRPMPLAAPAMAPRARPLVAAASALAAAPARLPISLPQRPRLTALPGGLVEVAPAGKHRISTPAVMVAAITIVILTFGAILGLQIRKTQVNEQMGSDLGAISALQQKVTATREQLNRESASANVDGAARKGGLFEPDLTDVIFTRAGNRTDTAERAKRLLSKAPVAPTAAQLEAAKAKAKLAASQAAAAGAATAATAPVTPASSAAVQTPSGAATSMASVPGATSQDQAAAAASSTTGTGAVQ